MTNTPLLSVRDLSVSVAQSGKPLVHNVSFDMAPGEIVGLVGESGSGKTLATRALISLLPSGVGVTSGTVTWRGRDIRHTAPRALRGAEIGLVFQEPMTSLNPSMLIGRQLEEGLILHTSLTAAERRGEILAMLRRVGLRDPEGALIAYPHEFSGGMRQRIMLASVMLLKPALLIADEPTTALDAVIQRDVMELMVELTTEQGTAVLLISHDLPMVARYTSRIIVMEKGVLVEQGLTQNILEAPQQDYTRKLLSALPLRGPNRQIDRTGPPTIAATDITVDYTSYKGFLKRAHHKRALHGVTLNVWPGEVVALVGGSGSGKTTLGRTMASLVRESSGTVLFEGQNRAANAQHYRLNCQMVFQDPYSSLNPRMTILALVEEALRLVPDLDAVAKRNRAQQALDEVGLGGEFGPRFPHELSGGQRQRVAIARAIVRRPKFLIADEPVSALDVTVRAQVLALFAELQRRYGFACLFISHDLGVVEQVADRVVVMQDGRIIEEGSRDAVFDTPTQAYTRRLLSAIPALETTASGGVVLKWRLEN